MKRSGGLHLDTAGVAAAQREELIHAAVADAVVPLDLEHRQGEGQTIKMKLDAADLGPVSIQSMRMSAIAARRTAHLARDDSPPSLFVIAKRTGFTAVVQNSRETVVGPGDLVLIRSTEPSLLLSDQFTDQDSLQISLAD